jgi:hypothetical protein
MHYQYCELGESDMKCVYIPWDSYHTGVSYDVIQNNVGLRINVNLRVF